MEQEEKYLRSLVEAGSLLEFMTDQVHCVRSAPEPMVLTSSLFLEPPRGDGSPGSRAARWMCLSLIRDHYWHAK